MAKLKTAQEEIDALTGELSFKLGLVGTEKVGVIRDVLTAKMRSGDKLVDTVCRAVINRIALLFADHHEKHPLDAFSAHDVGAQILSLGEKIIDDVKGGKP